MKKILIALLFLSSLFSSVLFAAGDVVLKEDTNMETISAQKEEVQIDENTKQVSNKYFDLILEKKLQSPLGNYVPYVLTIKPHINSSKTQILWNVPNTLGVTTKHEEFVNLVDGEEYTFKANIKPLREGSYDFSVSVISWQYDTNYTNSIDDNVTFNKGLVLQPTSSQYKILNIMKYLVILFVFVILCILAVAVVKKNMIKAKKWLTPPY